MRTIARPLFLYLVMATLLAVFMTAASSCSGKNCHDPAYAGTASCVAQRTLLDCTGGDIATAITEYGPNVRDAIKNGRQADGSWNWDTIDGDLEAVAIKYGGCVASGVFSAIINSKSVAPATSSAQPSPLVAREGFERLRARLWPTTTFKTPTGDL